MCREQEDTNTPEICHATSLLQTSNADSEIYVEPLWKELGWTHIRRFLTDIGPENTSLIQQLAISFYDASQSGNPSTSLS